MNPDVTALRNHRSVMLMAVLEQGALPVLAVQDALHQRSGGQFELPTTSISATLHRLEHIGQIAGSWCVIDGRDVMVYQLTSAGHDQLSEYRIVWQEFVAATDKLLKPLPAASGPST